MAVTEIVMFFFHREYPDFGLSDTGLEVLYLSLGGSKLILRPYLWLAFVFLSSLLTLSIVSSSTFMSLMVLVLRYLLLASLWSLPVSSGSVAILLVQTERIPLVVEPTHVASFMMVPPHPRYPNFCVWRLPNKSSERFLRDCAGAVSLYLKTSLALIGVVGLLWLVLWRGVCPIFATAADIWFRC